jgi:hypothetical protein
MNAKEQEEVFLLSDADRKAGRWATQSKLRTQKDDDDTDQMEAGELYGVGGRAKPIEQKIAAVDPSYLLSPVCRIQGCCGLGHRLQRNGKQFALVAYQYNKTAALDWGKTWVNGSMQPAFGSFFQDSKVLMDFLHFEDRQCGCQDYTFEVAMRPGNITCAKSCNRCGSGNEPDWHWKEGIPGYPYPTDSAAEELGWGCCSLLFLPYRAFFNALVQQLQPFVRWKWESFMEAHSWNSAEHGPVIGLHHRQGNGEIDDFNDGQGGGRGNGNDTMVVEWMHRSMQALAKHHGIAKYRVFFASDSPEMVGKYRMLDPHCIARDAELPRQGQGWLQMTGNNNLFAPSVKDSEWKDRVFHDTSNALIDMLLLGSTELLLISKCTSFATLPKAMMIEKGKPVAQAIDYAHGEKLAWATARPGEKVTTMLELGLQDAGLKTGENSYFYCSLYD